MRYYSLRRQTLLAFLLPLGGTIIGIIILTAFISYRNIAAMRDLEMEQDAAVLGLLFEHEALEGDEVKNAMAPFPEQLKHGRIEFRITARKGKVFESNGMPAVPDTMRLGFADIDSGDQSWRVIRRGGGEQIWIDVAEPSGLRRSLTIDVVTSVAVPLVALSLAIALIFSLRINATLKPLLRLSHDLERRGSGDLRPIRGYPLPLEIRSLAEALNDLLGRLQASFEREREFSDNAAHELRTPLAVLKTRAQLIERGLADNPAFAGEVKEFVTAIDRAANVIDRMLELARLASPAAQHADFSLSQVVGEVARDLAPLAVQKGLDLAAEIAPGIMVHGFEEALRGAVRNLIENAIKFTPPGGNIGVYLEREGLLARFAVEDDGVGIAPGAEKTIFHRFQRLDRNIAGAGLGLALVEKAVKLHDGRTFVARPGTRGIVIGFEIPSMPSSTTEKVAFQKKSPIPLSRLSRIII